VGIGSFWLFKELQEPVFLSLPGTQPPLPALLVRRRCPSVQRGRVSSLTTPRPLFSRTLQRECAHPCNVDRPLLSNPPCDVSVPVCVTWAGNFSRPSLPSSPSYPLTHPAVDPSDGESTPPREPRCAVHPCPAPRALRPATCAVPYVPRIVQCLTSRNLRRTVRPTPRDCAAPYDPQCAHVPCPTPARCPALCPRCSPFPLRPTVPLSPATHCPTSPRPTCPIPLRLPI
jgi:hypothetical protein